MQQSIIRPKQAAALFGVSLSTLWNWNNPKHWLYGLQRPHLRTAAGGAQHRLHHGTDKKPVRPNRETRALLVNAGGQGMKANQLATACQGVAVTITAKYGMRADSRNIAELLGIKHRSFMKTIDRYQEKLAEVEQRTNPSNPFYHVRFEISRGRREQGGGTPERYALLTETQCYFIGTLSKNTERVVDFKARLVIAFAQAQKLQSVHDNEYSP